MVFFAGSLVLAVDQGHADAQYNLGWCYHKGNGVAKDIGETVRLYQLAAKQGHVWAQHNLSSPTSSVHSAEVLAPARFFQCWAPLPRLCAMSWV